MAIPPKKSKPKVPSFNEVMTDEKPAIPSFNEVMGEKKNGGEDVSNGLTQSTSQLPLQEDKPVSGIALFDDPLTSNVEDFNKEFEDVTGYKKFDLTEPVKRDNLLSDDIYEKRKEAFEQKKFTTYQQEKEKINKASRKIFFGAIEANELSQLQKNPYSRNIVNNVIREYVPEVDSLSGEGGLYPTANPEKYETKLSSEQEPKFQTWLDENYKEGKIQKGDYDFYKENGYGYGYDFRAAFEKGEEAKINKTDGQWHWSDIGKKPNHPSFSDESKYNGVDGLKGGSWKGEVFTPPLSSQLLENSEVVSLASRRIKEKNRINAVNAEEESIKLLDEKLLSDFTNLRAVKVNVGLEVSDIEETPLGGLDLNNSASIQSAIAKLKNIDYIIDPFWEDEKEDKIDNKKEQLLQALNDRLFYNVSKQGITPTISQLNDQIQQTVLSKTIREDNDVANDEKKVNQFKLGLTALEFSNPVLFKTVINSIAQKKDIGITDFGNIAQAGQEIDNRARFRGGAYNPELIDTETNFDYSTFDQKKALASAQIGEWMKDKGYKNVSEFPEKLIRQSAQELGISKGIENSLVFDEKLGGYDAIPKSGWIDDVVSGFMQPFEGINSTISAWNESPVQTYLRSSKLASSTAQKVPDEAGNISEVLPSEREKFTTDMFRGLGQFIPQVLLTKGVGAGLKAGAALSGIATTANQAKNLTYFGGTIASTFLQSYGQSYEEHLKKTGDSNTAALMGTIDGIVSGAFETILPDAKLADKAFGGLKSGLANDLVGLVKKGGDITELPNKARPYIEKFVKNALNISAQENLEELGTQAVDFITESIFDPESAKDRNLNKELWDVAKSTFAAMSIPAILGAGGSSFQKEIIIKNLHSAAINFDKQKESLQKTLDNGYIDQDEFNKAVQILSTHRESISAAPDVNANGKPLDTQEKLDYAYESTKVKVYNDKVSKATTTPEKSMWEGKIKDAEKIQEEILIPKETVAVTITEEQPQSSTESTTQPADVTTEVSNAPLIEKAIGLLDEKIKEGNLGVFANMDIEETGITDEGVDKIEQVAEEKTEPIEGKSILNQDTDLKGNKKAGWMKPVGNDGEQINSLRKQVIELALTEDTEGGVKFKQAIEDGRMTANDAKTIIESAGLEVPKEIIYLIEKQKSEPVDVSIENKNEDVKGVSSNQKIKDAFDKYDDGNNTFDDFVNDVENLANETGQRKLIDAVDKYRKEQEDDRKLGGRGDMDAAEKEFQNTVLPKDKTVTKVSDSTNKETLDFTDLSKEELLKKLVSSSDNNELAAIQKELKKRAVTPTVKEPIKDKENKKSEPSVDVSTVEGKNEDLGGLKKQAIDAKDENEFLRNIITDYDTRYKNRKDATTLVKSSSIEDIDKIKPSQKLEKETVNYWKEEIGNGKNPFVIIRDNNTIDGQHKLEAYKQLGYKDIPVLYEKDLKDFYSKTTSPKEIKSDKGIVVDKKQVVEIEDWDLPKDEFSRNAAYIQIKAAMLNGDIIAVNKNGEEMNIKSPSQHLTKTQTYQYNPEIDYFKAKTDKGRQILSQLNAEQVARETAPKSTEKPIGKFEAKAREIVAKKKEIVVPKWLINTAPTIKKQGLDAASLNRALDDAIIAVGKALDRGVELIDAIKEGANELIDFYTKSLGAKKLKPDFEKQLRDGFDNHYRENIFGENAPPKPPIDDNVSDTEDEGDGKGRIDDAVSDITETGGIKKYLSGKTIEKYTGEEPTNNQNYTATVLKDAFEQGENVIQVAKDVYGKEYVPKMLDYIVNSNMSVSQKALLYVTLRNDLYQRRMEATDSNEYASIIKLQELSYAKSQAFAHENAVAMNMWKLQNLQKYGYNIDDTTSSFMSESEMEDRAKIEDAVQVDDDAVNKEADVNEGAVVGNETTEFYEDVEKENAAAKANKPIRKKSSKSKWKAAAANKGKLQDLIDNLKDKIKKLNC